MSANPIAGTTVTGISGGTATVKSFNGDTGVITLGILHDFKSWRT